MLKFIAWEMDCKQSNLISFLEIQIDLIKEGYLREIEYALAVSPSV